MIIFKHSLEKCLRATFFCILKRSMRQSEAMLPSAFHNTKSSRISVSEQRRLKNWGVWCSLIRCNNHSALQVLRALSSTSSSYRLWRPAPQSWQASPSTSDPQGVAAPIPLLKPGIRWCTWGSFLSPLVNPSGISAGVFNNLFTFDTSWHCSLTAQGWGRSDMKS